MIMMRLGGMTADSDPATAASATDMRREYPNRWSCGAASVASAAAVAAPEPETAASIPPDAMVATPSGNRRRPDRRYPT